jgi:hypothetical protein
MTETEIEELQRSSLAMYLGLDSLYKLHAEIELEETQACAHCSAMADGVVAYPCPSVQIMLNDFEDVIEEAISESF